MGIRFFIDFSNTFIKLLRQCDASLFFLLLHFNCESHQYDQPSGSLVCIYILPALFFNCRYQNNIELVIQSKHSYAVTYIKQPPVLKGHLFLILS